MRKILFDGTYYQGGSRFHGGGEYGDTVLRELLKRDVSSECGFFYREKYGIDEKIRKKLEDANWKLHPMDMMRELPDIVKEYGYMTIFSPLPYINNWHWFQGKDDGIRFVGAVHGLRSMELGFYDDLGKDFFSDEKLTLLPSSKRKELEVSLERYGQSLLVFQNSTIITDSEHSKHSILHYYPQINRNDITVLYPPQKDIGSSINAEEEKTLLKKIGIKENIYAMMTSANHWYKNPIRAAMAFDYVFSGNYSFVPEDYKFLIIGNSEDKEGVLSRIENKDRFIFVDYVETEELEILYKNTHMLMYPSLNEGFGYPPLEAMKYGTVCVCSANAAITEICRDMVWYFNPIDVDEMAIRIIQAFSEEERDKKRRRMSEVLPEISKRQIEDLTKVVDIILEV